MLPKRVRAAPVYEARKIDAIVVGSGALTVCACDHLLDRFQELESVGD